MQSKKNMSAKQIFHLELKQPKKKKTNYVTICVYTYLISNNKINTYYI